MIGTLAQIIVLITYGNLILLNQPIEIKSDNESLKFCNKIQFVEINKFLFIKTEKEIANNPNTWFKYLKTNKCKNLKLYYIKSDNKEFKDYQSSGFVGGGGDWIIEAIYDNYSDLWESSWKVTKENDPNNKIWTVTYYKIASKIKKINHNLNPNIKKELIISLENIYDFSKKYREQSWTKIFNESIDCLNNKKLPKLNYYKDMIAPNSLSNENLNLFISAVNSWVFGAMGSWNDWYNEDKKINELFDKVTNDLYYKINESIEITINSSATSDNSR